MLRMRALPAGFIAPCLPTKTDKLPSGSQWLHEIKHDGFRIIARKDGQRVRLYSRPGNDLTRRYFLFQSVYCSESMPVLNRDATKVKIILTTIQYVFRPMSDSFQVST